MGNSQVFIFLINSNHIANVLLIAFMSNVYCAVLVCDRYLARELNGQKCREEKKAAMRRPNET